MPHNRTDWIYSLSRATEGGHVKAARYYSAYMSFPLVLISYIHQVYRVYLYCHAFASVYTVCIRLCTLYVFIELHV